MENSMNWGIHVTEDSRKVYASLHFLYRLKNFFPFKTKLMRIQSLILPIINNADVCYPDLNKNFLNKLEHFSINSIR